MANVMAIIALVFPAEHRGQALGLIGSVVAAGTLAGPPLGGVLTAWLGWRSIFWINLPVGIWAVIGAMSYIPRLPVDQTMRSRPFDWMGAILFLTTTSLLQFALAEIHTVMGWIFLAGAILSLGFFIKVEQKPLALVPLRLFKVWTFSANMISGMAYWILMMFPAFLVPFYLRQVLGLPIGLVGVSMMPQALLMILVSPWGGRWTDRVGVVPPARVGMGIFVLVDAIFGFYPGIIPLGVVWILLAIQGVAAGLFSSPNSAAILGSVERSDMGLASSLMATQRNLGRALGVGLASVILSLIWILHGLGPTPSHAAVHYPEWFRWGFHGVFIVGIGFAIVGWVTTVASIRERSVSGGQIPDRQTS